MSDFIVNLARRAAGYPTPVLIHPSQQQVSPEPDSPATNVDSPTEPAYVPKPSQPPARQIVDFTEPTTPLRQITQPKLREPAEEPSTRKAVESTHTVFLMPTETKRAPTAKLDLPLATESHSHRTLPKPSRPADRATAEAKQERSKGTEAATEERGKIEATLQKPRLFVEPPPARPISATTATPTATHAKKLIEPEEPTNIGHHLIEIATTGEAQITSHEISGTSLIPSEQNLPYVIETTQLVQPATSTLRDSVILNSTDRSALQSPSVHVHIGTIEVRNTAPTPAPPPLPKQAPSPQGFDEYVRLRTYTKWQR